jgi:hypothetical protein
MSRMTKNESHGRIIGKRPHEEKLRSSPVLIAASLAPIRKPLDGPKFAGLAAPRAAGLETDELAEW